MTFQEIQEFFKDYKYSKKDNYFRLDEATMIFGLEKFVNNHIRLTLSLREKYLKDLEINKKLGISKAPNNLYQPYKDRLVKLIEKLK